MKYYKDEKDRIFGYDDCIPEFGQGNEGQTTVLEGLIPITEQDAKAILAEQNKPTKEQIIENNQVTVKLLINDVTLEIDVLQDAIDLDMAEEGDADKLKKWRKYRVLLSRVDTSVEDMKLPKKPD